MQDTACASGASHSGRLRLVPTPSARGAGDAARRAPESLARPLQLLRGSGEPAEFGLPAVARPPGVAQVAEPSQPAGATDMGAVPGLAPGLPAAHPSGRGATLGGPWPPAVPTEEPDGGNLLVRIWEGPGRVTGRGYSTSAQRPGRPRNKSFRGSCLASHAHWLSITGPATPSGSGESSRSGDPPNCQKRS